MALIRCMECGQVISDKAAKCPRCGSQISNDGEDKQYSYMKEPTANRNKGYNGNGKNNDNNNNNNNNKKWLYAIIFLLGVIIGGGFYHFYYKNKQMERYLQQQQQQHIADSIAKDSIAKEKARLESTNKVKEDEPRKAETQSKVSQTHGVAIEGHHHLVGAISKYPITMDIEITRGHAQGTYYYHSQGRQAKMSVYGNIDGSQLYLEEYSPEGNNTGRFDGTFDGYDFNGTFVNYLNGNTFNFNVVKD